MENSFRVKPLDYSVVLDSIVEGTSVYLSKNKIQAMVIGISGGIDSTVVSAICRMVSDKIGIPLIGLSLPCNTNADDEKSAAALVGEEFCDEFQEINIEPFFENVEKMCTTTSGLESTAISQGNIKARLRMISLYDIASKRRGIVMGTSNRTEWLTGFWTLHGDVGDINPLGELWKTEVYGLTKYMLEHVFKGSKALEASAKLIPTDGNGVSKSDMDQIMPGYTYYEIDHVLSTWDNLADNIKPKYAADGLTESIKNTVFGNEDEDMKVRRKEVCAKYGTEFKPTLGDLYGVDSVRKVIMRSVGTEFKRKNLEVCVDLDSKGMITH